MAKYTLCKLHLQTYLRDKGNNKTINGFLLAYYQELFGLGRNKRFGLRQHIIFLPKPNNSG